MSRPFKFRKVFLDMQSRNYFFGPKQIPIDKLEKISLSLDELQAIKFADLEGLYQAKAGDTMGISRQTFGNLLKSGRKKIADAIINKKVLILEDSSSAVISQNKLPKCSICCHEWGSANCVNNTKQCSQ